MREYTLTQAEDLYELVKGRYRRGSLILTSNREPKDLYELFPTPVLAEGLLDRLLNSAYAITMLGRSYRPPTTTWRLIQRTIDQSRRPAAGKLP
jgi:DNA replication protein DnaC